MCTSKDGISDWIRFKLEETQGDLLVRELKRRIVTQEQRANRREEHARQLHAIAEAHETRQMRARLQARRISMQRRNSAQKPRIELERGRMDSQAHTKLLVYTDRADEDHARHEERICRAAERWKKFSEQSTLHKELRQLDDLEQQWAKDRMEWDFEKEPWPSTTEHWLYSASRVNVHIRRTGAVPPLVDRVLRNRGIMDAEHEAERARITTGWHALDNEKRERETLRKKLVDEMGEQQDENARWVDEDARLQAEAAVIRREQMLRLKKEIVVDGTGTSNE